MVSPIKRTLIGIAVAVLATALGVFGYQVFRARLSEAILAKIDCLALQPPKRTSELEWAVHVYWTHNLHCEAIPQVYASLSNLRELDRLLDDAIARGPDGSTIEALWSHYEAISESGGRYRKKYEPIRHEIADAVARNGESYADARSYQDFLKYARLQCGGRLRPTR